jgi:predicted aspartyl protease
MEDSNHTRRSFAAAIAGLTGLAACAQVTGQRTHAVQVNFTELASEGEDEGPTDLASAADLAKRMTVPVRVNGQGPYDFVVDTGANRSVISGELAMALGLAEAGKAPVHGIAGIDMTSTVMINRLDVGAVVSRRVRAPVLPAARLGTNGLLGVDVLKNRRVTMDFLNNRLQIVPSDSGKTLDLGGPPLVSRADTGKPAAASAPDPRLVTVPARYRFGQLVIIDADAGGLPVTAFLDSGSQNTVGNLALQRLVAPDAKVQPQSLVVQLLSATGQTTSGLLSPLPRLRIGGLVIGGMSAVFSDLHVFELWDLQKEPALLIGVDVMRHFDAVELDFGRRRVSFKLPASASLSLTPIGRTPK